MTDGWCDHCELPRSTCAHSPAARAAEAEGPIVQTGPVITAQIQGTCRLCTKPVYASESEIAKTEDYGWVHASHVTTPDRNPFEGMDL